MKKFIFKHPFMVICTLFLLMVSSLDNIVIADIFRQTYNVVETKETDQLLPILLKMVFLYGLISVAAFLSNYLQAKLIEFYNTEYRDKLYRAYFNRTEQDTGTFISLLTNDYKYFEENYLNVIFMMTKMVFYITFSITYAFFLDVYMAFIFILFSFISAIIPKIFQKPIQSASNEWSDRNSIYTNQLKENALGKNTIIGYGVEDISARGVRSLNSRMEASLRKISVWVAVSDSSVGYIGNILFLMPILLGIYMVANGNMLLGILLALMQVNNTIVGPFLSLLQNYNTMQSATSVLRKMKKQLQEYTKPLPHLKDMEKPITSFHFKDATIGYDKQTILDGVTLDITSGDNVLVVGESGSGKSTLLNAIKGSSEIIDGTFTINGVERRLLQDKSILQQISVIQQNIFLFDDSFMMNITLGENYSMSSVQSACEKAGLGQLVTEKGFSFKVGENGRNLSGGQQQRVEIARALLRGRGVLLIDEATSSLDKETANNIRETYLKMPPTIIEIAHFIDQRFLTYYDHIIILNKGKIVEYGAASELLQKEGTYLNQILLNNA